MLLYIIQLMKILQGEIDIFNNYIIKQIPNIEGNFGEILTNTVSNCKQLKHTSIWITITKLQYHYLSLLVSKDFQIY